MGAHAIYVDQSSKAYAFVNTCGSHSLSIACERFEIPLLVVGEMLKIAVIPPATVEDHFYLQQETDLSEGLLPANGLSTKRTPVSFTNFGVDLVPVHPMTKILVPDAVAS
jgi:translation initiation factor 2B subunit (eIF-2B alpha/beta/delta family)